ncbi:hypothetical protein MHBO_003867, partial [Bonamia ostreae]
MLIKTPCEETNVNLLILPKKQLEKLPNGSFMKEDRKQVFRCAKIAFEIAENKTENFNGSIGVIIEHEKSNWSIVRMLILKQKLISKHLVHDVCEGYEDWKQQNLTETIMCLSLLSTNFLNILRE